MFRLLVLLGVLVISGCGGDEIAARAGIVTDWYCGKEPAARELLRAQVATYTAPHRLVIECAGD